MILRQPRAAWAAVIVLGVLLPFAPAVLGHRTLAHRDTDQLYAPVRTLVVEALRDGRFPLWNPYEGTGKPLFAEGIHSVLHPLSLLAAFVAPSSIDFLILAYLVAAALGTFLLASTLGASSPAGAGAGLAYALSGYSVSMTGNLVFLAGLSTLPWLLAAARSAGNGSRWGTVFTSLATVSAFFSGDVQITLVGLVLGTLLAADGGGPRGVARALAGFVPGILLAGVQILATYELLPLTYRGSGLDELEKVQWPLALGRLLEWFVPGLVRGPLAQVPLGASGTPLTSVFAESIYLGVPLVFAAGLGTTALGSPARRRSGFLLVGAAGVLLWLALGHQLGARQLLEWVPVWSQFRYSEKLMAPLALCLATVAALGVDAFAAGRISSTFRRALAIAALASGAAFVTLLAAPGVTTDLAPRLLGDGGPFHRVRLLAGLPHLLVGLGALLAADCLRGSSARGLSIALLVSLAPAVAVRFGSHLGLPGVRTDPSPLRLESAPPGSRIAHPAYRRFDQQDIRDFVDSTARALKRTLVTSSNVAWRVDTLDDYGGFGPLRLATLAVSLGEPWALAYRRFALTHVVVGIPFGEQYRTATEAAVDGGLRIQHDETLGFELWAVPHRPWAFFARRASAEAEPPQALELLLDLIARGDDGMVVVEAPEAPPTAPGRLLSVTRGTEALRVEAESLGPALLVVQDAFWPGWRASIDGEPAEILAADYLVRAVRWPAGRHTLEMVYEPPEIRTGLGVSAFGACLVLILAGLAFRRPRAVTLP